MSKLISFYEDSNYDDNLYNRMSNKKLGVILFMGRANCSYSKKVETLLKKQSNKLYYFESNNVGEKIDDDLLKINYDYIFCFRSYYILKKKLLKRVNNFAINFHPGPPEYRGTGCVNYAVYENSKFYGSTAHIIDEKIDNGKIIEVKKFKIKKNNTISEILNKTYEVMSNQAISIINKIKSDSTYLEKQILKNKNIKWSKKIKKLKELNKFYQIDINLSKKDFLNKIRATNTPKFKPYVKIYGKNFFLE